MTAAEKLLDAAERAARDQESTDPEGYAGYVSPQEAQRTIEHANRLGVPAIAVSDCPSCGEMHDIDKLPQDCRDDRRAWMYADLTERPPEAVSQHGDELVRRRNAGTASGAGSNTTPNRRDTAGADRDTEGPADRTDA